MSKARNIWPPDKLLELPNKIALLVLGARLFGGSTFLGNLKVDSKTYNHIVCMDVMICHDLARGLVFTTTAMWESIHKFDDIPYHMDNHNTWYLFNG